MLSIFASIKNRLTAAMLAVLIILVAMVTLSGIFLSRFEAAYQTQDQVDHIVRLIQQARVAEKAYRQYYQDRYMREVIAHIKSVNEYISLKNRIPKHISDVLSESSRAYQEAFTKLVSLHGRHVRINETIENDVAGALKKAEGLMTTIHTKSFHSRLVMGGRMDPLEAGLLSPLQDIRHMGVFILLNHQRYLLTNDETNLSLLYQYIQTYGPGLFGALELGSKFVKNTDYQHTVADIRKKLERCVTRLENSQQLMHAEERQVEQLDTIGHKLTSEADRTLSDAVLTTRKLKSTAVTLVVVLLLLGIVIIMAVTVTTYRSITKPLGQMVDTARKIREGNLKLTISTNEQNEFSELAKALNSTTSHLAESLQLLEAEVQERKIAEHELKMLSRNMIAGQENERSSIARELHDELGQLLTVLKIQTSRLSNNGAPNDGHLKEALKGINSVIDRIIDAVKDLAVRLRPKILDTMKLGAALHWMTQDFEKKTGIQCHLQVEAFELNDKAVEVTIYRVAQECLTNVARHSYATQVRMEMGLTDSCLRFHIADNGEGFDLETQSRQDGLGISGMRERARLIGGEISIQSAHREGCEVTLLVSLEG